MAVKSNPGWQRLVDMLKAEIDRLCNELATAKINMKHMRKIINNQKKQKNGQYN